MFNLQWRTNSGYDSILIVDLSNDPDVGEIKTAIAPATKAAITETLTDIGDLHNWSGDDWPGLTPEDYGVLVMERSNDGGVVYIDAELLTRRMEFWFSQSG